MSEPVDHVTLRQPDTVDGRAPHHRASRSDRRRSRPDRRSCSTSARSSSDGQRIDIDPTDGGEHHRRADHRDQHRDRRAPTDRRRRSARVGFADVDFGLEPTTELIRVPTDGATATRRVADPAAQLRVHPAPRRPDRPLAVRSGADAAPASSRCRNDAEFDTSVVAARRPAHGRRRRSPSCSANRCTPTPTSPACRGARGAAAVRRRRRRRRGSPRSARPSGSRCQRRPRRHGRLRSRSPSRSGRSRPITQVRVSDPAGSFDLDVPTGPGDRRSPSPARSSSRDTTIEITAVDERTTVDRRFGEAVVLPAAISEITFDGASPADRTGRRDHVDECRDDLLSVDGTPVGLSFTPSTETDPARRQPIDATVCAADGSSVLALAAGTHTLHVDPGARRRVPRRPGRARRGRTPRAAADATPAPTVSGRPRRRGPVGRSRCRRVPRDAGSCSARGTTPAGRRRDDDGSLGEPTLVDGNANGWWIEPTDEPTTITITLDRTARP